MKKSGIMICLFHPNGKTQLFYCLKIIYYIQTRCHNCAADELEIEYLIAQLRPGFRQKLFGLRSSPQGILQAQLEKSGFLIFVTSIQAGPYEKWPIKIR